MTATLPSTRATRTKPSRKPRTTAKNPKYLDDPEVILMLRVQREEPGAFAELVELYWTKIFGRLFRRLGDRQEAEDLTQEVFLRVYRHRKRYQPRAKFATWLFHISQNVARNALRSRRRHPSRRLSMTTPLENGLSVECLLPDRSEAPSRPLERAELAGIVRAAVSDLGSRQRIALELHQFEDWTYAEIAAEMDMSPKAAKSLLYRARNQLRANLTACREGLQ
jgi:RNA polymerase sigma-70 factor (ECF subfamily)